MHFAQSIHQRPATRRSVCFLHRDDEGDQQLIFGAMLKSVWASVQDFFKQYEFDSRLVVFSMNQCTSPLLLCPLLLHFCRKTLLLVWNEKEISQIVIARVRIKGCRLLSNTVRYLGYYGRIHHFDCTKNMTNLRLKL